MRKGVDGDFAGYVLSRQHRLLRAAYLVCGDERRAEELVRRALTDLAMRWGHLRDGDPDAYVNRVLYRDVVSWRHLLHHERPAPDPALAELTPRHRAVQVLRYFEDLTETETADQLGVTVGTVKEEGRRVVDPERLEEASAGVPEVDLTERVWADAYVASRRRRWWSVLLVIVVVVVLVVAAILAAPQVQHGSDDLLPTPVRPTQATSVPRTGTIAGLPFWTAPPSGSEAWLDRLDTGLGDKLTVPPGELQYLRERPVSRVGAVLLRPTSPGHYRPVVLSARGRWAQAELDLVPTVDADGNESPPLTATAVSPVGSLVAFPQPNAVVILDTTTGTTRRITVPSPTIRNVGWMPSGDLLLASGDAGTYLVSASGLVSQVDARSDPSSATPPMALDSIDTREALVRIDPSGERTADLWTDLPVSSWLGATFTTNTLAARTFIPDSSSQLRSLRGDAEVVAVLDGRSPTAGALLLMGGGGDLPRAKNCCGVLGWYDEHTLLVESRTTAWNWILAWDVLTGRVMRVTELDADAVAIGQLS